MGNNVAKVSLKRVGGDSIETLMRDGMLSPTLDMGVVAHLIREAKRAPFLCS